MNAPARADPAARLAAHEGAPVDATRLLVVNPNQSTAMTDDVLAAIRALAGARLALRGVTAHDGPHVVASRQTFAEGAAAALRALARHDDGWADAVLLACYGDPGLDALRAASRVPVLGMADSSIRQALASGRRFHIVTAGAAWDAMLREVVAGISDSLARERHAGIAGISGTSAAAETFDGITILDTDGRAIAEDPDAAMGAVQGVLDTLAARGVPDCILGGAGFAQLTPQLRYAGRLTDGLRSAIDALFATRAPR